jgi:replicative DNA helicase
MSSIPQNQQAEKAALSILHHSPECFALSWKQELFHHPAHRILFRTIEEQAALGRPTDQIALTSRLEANGQLAAIGGPGALDSILSTLLRPNPKQARCYYEDLAKAQRARETVKAVKDNLPDLERMQLSPTAFVEKVANAAQGPEVTKRCTLKEHLDSFVAELEREEAREAFSTGLTRLDLAVDGGIHRGELLVVAGETSQGKSVLLAQAALASAQAGKAVDCFLWKCQPGDILARMAANIAEQRIKSVREKSTNQEKDAISAAVTSAV